MAIKLNPNKEVVDIIKEGLKKTERIYLWIEN